MSALNLNPQSKAQLDDLLVTLLGSAAVLSAAQKADFLATLVSWRAQQNDAAFLALRGREVAALERTADAQVKLLAAQLQLVAAEVARIPPMVAP